MNDQHHLSGNRPGCGAPLCRGSCRCRADLSWTGDAAPFDPVQDFPLRLIENDWPMYAAMDHNDLVDRADITPVGVPECVHRGVLGMGIVTSHRGAGPGPRLLDACLEPAPRCGITKVGLPVFTSNTAAIALYRRADFTDIATIKDYRRLDCVSYDVLMMEKFLA